MFGVRGNCRGGIGRGTHTRQLVGTQQQRSSCLCKEEVRGVKREECEVRGCLHHLEAAAAAAASGAGAAAAEEAETPDICAWYAW